MPATRLTARTSPFLRDAELIRLSGVGLLKCTVPTAMAVRMVWALEETETMCAEPEEVRCGSEGVGDFAAGVEEVEGAGSRGGREEVL